MSVTKALEHSAFRCHRNLILKVNSQSRFHVWISADGLGQWVNSSDLEPETQVSNPAKYHDAWKAVVSAGCVRELSKDCIKT